MSARPAGKVRGRIIVLSAVALSFMACGSSSSTAPGPGDAIPATPTTGGGSNVYGEIEESYGGSGPRVAVLGDSLMVASRQRLRSLLDGHSLKVAALTGEGLAGGSISAAVGGGGMTEVAATYAADDPAVAVIALGTNDAWLEQLTADEAIAGLETIVDALADACLVMVTITESASAEGYDVAEAREINDSIEAAADEVVDWRRISTSEVGLLRPDDIHPTPAGAEVFAAAIADAVERCPA